MAQWPASFLEWQRQAQEDGCVSCMECRHVVEGHRGEGGKCRICDCHARFDTSVEGLRILYDCAQLPYPAELQE